jgi:5-methyltetrahydrofolate--homocysteine methyltransferase
MADLEGINKAIVKGKRNEVVDLVKAAVDEGVDPQSIISDYMIEAMKEVGSRFETKKIFVPEMMMAARTMQAGLEILKPLLSTGEGSKISNAGTVVIGTVFGDLHDIGKNLVVLMLESSGFEVHNIGENVAPEKFVEKAKELDADVVGMSSLLTTGDPYVKATVEALKNSDIADRIKVICGGAAVTPKYAIEVCGADGHAQDAVSAVKICSEFMEKK